MIARNHANNLWNAIVNQFDIAYQIGLIGHQHDIPDHAYTELEQKYNQDLQQLIYRFMIATGWQPKPINSTGGWKLIARTRSSVDFS